MENLTKLEIKPPYDPAIPLLGTYPEKVNWKIYKCVIIKQYTSEHSMNQRREGIQNISWNKQKRKHNISKLMGCSQSSSNREGYNINVKTERKDLKQTT